jgi:hypothetical protein
MTRCPVPIGWPPATGTALFVDRGRGINRPYGQLKNKKSAELKRIKNEHRRLKMKKKILVLWAMSVFAAFVSLPLFAQSVVPDGFVRIEGGTFTMGSPSLEKKGVMQAVEISDKLKKLITHEDIVLAKMDTMKFLRGSSENGR